MIKVDLMNNDDIKIEMKVFDFLCKFNNALKENKCIQVTSVNGIQVYLNPNNIVKFAEY